LFDALRSDRGVVVLRATTPESMMTY